MLIHQKHKEQYMGGYQPPFTITSLKIEANSLSLSQVRDVINGNFVLGEAKEIQDVKNAYNAYEKKVYLMVKSVYSWLRRRALFHN